MEPEPGFECEVGGLGARRMGMGFAVACVVVAVGDVGSVGEVGADDDEGPARAAPPTDIPPRSAARSSSSSSLSLLESQASASHSASR